MSDAYEIIDLSEWELAPNIDEGSGRSKKIWLSNPKTQQTALFKYRKDNQTYEHVSEKLSSELAKLIELPTAEIDIANYKEDIGSMSYKINKNEDIVLEGISFINYYFPTYRPDEMYDSTKEEYYSLEMIKTSLENINPNDCNKLMKTIYHIMIFDFLIGNTDRHPSNWGVLFSTKEPLLTIASVYDNGSSLCSYIADKKIHTYLGNDLLHFEALVDTKSKSRIRIDNKLKTEPTHREVIKHLIAKYRSDITPFIENIFLRINERSISCILDKFHVTLISEERKKLLLKFLLSKINILQKEYKE